MSANVCACVLVPRIIDCLRVCVVRRVEHVLFKELRCTTTKSLFYYYYYYTLNGKPKVG